RAFAFESGRADARRTQLSIDLACPAKIGARIRRARMQDLDDPWTALERGASPPGREAANPDHPFGLEALDHRAQVAVAGGEQRLPLGRRQLVGSAVLAAFLEEEKRAVVRDVVLCEESRRLDETLGDRAPEACAAHLAARAVEAENGPARVLARG